MLIPITDIWADQSNNKSRVEFTPESVHSLAASIAEHGMQQPVKVIPIEHPQYKYRLVFGYRRFTAVSVILGYDEIDAVIDPAMSEEQADLANAMENIERQDLTFYEECLCLRRLFPETAQQTDIGRTLQKSRTWVRNRWLLWKLPEAVIEQVQSGDLGPAEVSLLIQQESPEEATAAAEKIKRGKAAGEAIRSMEGSLSNRRGPRKKKDVQRMMTVLMGAGCEREMQTLRFACGEISDSQLLEYLGIRNVDQSSTNLD